MQFTMTGVRSEEVLTSGGFAEASNLGSGLYLSAVKKTCPKEGLPSSALPCPSITSATAGMP